MSDPGLALRKVLKSRGQDLEHYLAVFAIDMFYTQKMAYTAISGSNYVEYIGYAKPGTPAGSPGWMIKKLTYSGTDVTDVQLADGEAAFDKIWNSRAGYSYS